MDLSQLYRYRIYHLMITVVVEIYTISREYKNTGRGRAEG